MHFQRKPFLVTCPQVVIAPSQEAYENVIQD